MSKNKIMLILALAFPIICLLVLTVYKAAKLNAGTKIVIPISGYDPRDLLSGHYLVYQVNYNSQNPACEKTTSEQIFYFCVRQLNNHQVESNFILSDYEQPEKGCTVKIQGQCEYGRFKAGIERFYIPEEYSYKLDKYIRDKQGKIIVSVDSSGTAMVKELLINDMPWMDFIKQAEKENSQPLNKR